ncbi:helix-hairpin-helix domain-containing protein, partial [Methanospirillum sp.]|uniref:helix-hairpin-helix domain-containing protein n=1 Tax=Methanospirillum sp. TaxID=45200 RepID=UPI002CD56B4E
NDWADEVSEGMIEERYGIGAGDLYNIIDSGKWLLHGTERLVSVEMPEMSGIIKTLSIRVQHGVRPELLPLVALRNIGRVRARSLYNAGYPDPEAVARAGLPSLARILGEAIARQVINDIIGAKKSSKQMDNDNAPHIPELLTDIPGIGKKMAEKLQNAGILSGTDLLNADEMILSDILGAARARKILAFLTKSEEQSLTIQQGDSMLDTRKIRGQSSWEDFGW